MNAPGSRSRTLILLIALTLAVAACTGSAGKGQEHSDATPPLLLISIDGARHDYLERVELPALERLMAGGLRADSLQQVFPTKTFTTHYTMVTGLYAGHHGVVANRMWDPDRDAEFSLGDRDAVSDGYWYDGEPIWNTVEKAGRIAATYFWPGSEARIDGIRPTHFKPYAGDTPHDERVDQVLDWLDLPAGERPDFLTLYFSVVDSVGHARGPDSPRVDDAMQAVDAAIGRLLDGLEARGLLGEMHILVTSDHGMTQVDLDRYVMLDDYLPLDRVRVSDWGPAAQIWATEMPAEAIVAALEGAHPRLRAWARDDIPARYHFRDHRRIPDVLAEADPGWMITNKPYYAGMERGQLNGMHGWDPAVHEMHGIFIAHGPAFAAGGRIPATRSVDLYPLMAKLMSIEPVDTDGSMAAFEPVLEDPDSARVRESVYDCGGEVFRVRLGPGAAGVHHDARVYALPRSDAGGYADTGVVYRPAGEGATFEIDGGTWRDCREAGAD